MGIKRQGETKPWLDLLMTEFDRVLREGFSMGLNKQKTTILVCSKRQTYKYNKDNNKEKHYSGSERNLNEYVV